MPKVFGKDVDPLGNVERAASGVNRIVEKRGRSVFGRYPLVFSLLGTFGFVSVLYGFEKTIDDIDWLADRPILILVVGLVLLSITGGLYKRLRG